MLLENELGIQIDSNIVLFYRAIVISGGPGSVNDPNPAWCDPQIFELGIPILGICYGHQVCWL